MDRWRLFRPRLPDRDDLAARLLVEEYLTLRQEAHQSLEYAQGIVKWSLAIFGAVLAAGLIATEKLAAGANDAVTYSALILFGFALPGVMWAATLNWLGELLRMERAGAYLRGLEAEIAALPGIDRLIGQAPLRWERFIRAQRHTRVDGKRSPMGKQLWAYVGTAAVFGGSTAVSLAIFLIIWGFTFEYPEVVPPEGWWWPISALVLEIACLTLAMAIGRKVLRLGDFVAPITTKP